ncbi:MAG: YhbY family RNA-binding protein [Oscillospiraceae bacterium]|jgi:RNA-binding protein|nr:YhbY family RNA-binding protein [Oscillospiraceae bacterium]
MITGKQRARLRAIANGCKTTFRFGKSTEIDSPLVSEVERALSARELIKLRVLNGSDYTAREAAAELSARTGSEIVQIIGTRFVLYKKSPDPLKRKIDID